MKIVYAKQPFPDSWTSALFLVGPTPRNKDVPSWRPEALRLLKASNYDGVVFVPEVEDGEWRSGPDAYDEQVEWERKGLDLADVILCWVPRKYPEMAAATTNVEFGRYVTSDKIVLGAPEWAVGISYLERMLLRDTGTCHRYMDLQGAIEACRTKLENLCDDVWEGGGQGSGSLTRTGGERCVPLHIWGLQSFQNWYQNLVQVGNRLDDAKLLWHFRPPKARSAFSWVLWVNVWIEKEQCHKSNEYVFARSDISTVCLYHLVPNAAAEDLCDTEIILVREFRSPARNPDMMVHELPGGSSLKPGKDPLQVASEEVHEETGLIVAASRFKPLGSRQLAATLSSHHAHLFAAELTETEMAQAKALAAANAVEGVEEDSERTYIEVTTFGKMLQDQLVDWSMLGMVAQAILVGQ